MSRKVDEFFDLQDVIGNALNSIGGDMDDITGGIAVNGDEDVLTMSLYSTVDKKNARNFKRKFFDTIEKALRNTRFNDVSRDENYTFAYQLSENDLLNHIGPRATEEFKDKFVMFEILITAYADQEVLTESGNSVKVPAPYNKYFEVSEYQPEAEDYQIGERIDGYDTHLLAYLEVKQEYIEETDIQPVLVDDKDFPVVEIVGGRLIPVNLNAVFVNDDTIDESVEEYIEIVDPSLVDKLDFAGAVEMRGNRVYADANTLRQLQDAIDDIAESYEFDDDDFEDDIMHSNVYGGDSKYCRECGTVKKYDEDGFAYCPQCQENDELINETYWIDNKEVMDKVHRLQDELEADGWTQNGDRYTGSKYYSFYMKPGDDKAIWKAIRYSHTDEPEVIDVTYRQVMGDHSLDSIDSLRKDLGKMLLPKKNSVQEAWDDLESIHSAYDAYVEDCAWKQVEPISFGEFKNNYLGDKEESEEEFKSHVKHWAVLATDKDTGKEYYAGVYPSEKWAYYWAGMDSSADAEYGYGNFEYRVEQVPEYTEEMDNSKSELTKVKLDRYDSRKYESAKRSDASKKLNESPKGFYVTTYYSDSRWSPEEGGTMDYGWQADKSKFFRTEQEAQEYLDNQLVGMEIKTKYDGYYQYEDEHGDLQMIAIEPSGKRGRWHSPARSWTEIEFDDPVERPYFDRKGSRVERNPRLVAKERKEAAALEKEFRDAVDNATTKEELIEIATDAKFMNAFSKFGSILVDKFQELN